MSIHSTLTTRDFFLAYFYPSDPFTCIFFEASPDFFPVLAVANTSSCAGPQNKNINRSPSWMQVAVLCARGIVSLLVGALSPVNHRGLHQG